MRIGFAVMMALLVASACTSGGESPGGTFTVVATPASSEISPAPTEGAATASGTPTTAPPPVAIWVIDSLTGETLVLFFPALGLVIALSSRSGSAVDIASSTEWAFLLGTGLITAVPLMLFASAAQSIPFTLLGPLNLLVPVINFGLGWAIYDEPMPFNRLIGFAFVWMALIVVMTDRVRESRRRNRVATPPVTAQ